jgi:hypothetical protein
MKAKINQPTELLRSRLVLAGDEVLDAVSSRHYDGDAANALPFASSWHHRRCGFTLGEALSVPS